MVTLARCGCSGQTCSCLIQGGDGIEVAGSGTVSDPYIVSTEGIDIAGSIQFIDTDTVDFTVTGSGTEANPYSISAQATLALDDLTDVDAAAPTDNYVLAWNGTAWVPAPPATVDPGAISVAEPITGTGQASDPIGLDLQTSEWVTGDGTAANPLDVDLRYAMGTTEVPDIASGTAKSVAVTFPAGRFDRTPYITLGMYSSTTGSRFPAHSAKSVTGFTMICGYLGQSASVDVWISWHAIQMPNVDVAAAAAFAARAPSEFDQQPGDPLPDTVATCRTAGCSNEGIGIPIATKWIDDEGVENTVAGVQCGVCQLQITDLQPVS